MPESGLLSSWATPLTISPIARSRSACWSWEASSFSTETLRARMSTPLPTPPSPTSGCISAATQRGRPSAWVARNSMPRCGPAGGRLLEGVAEAGAVLGGGELVAVEVAREHGGVVEARSGR